MRTADLRIHIRQLCCLGVTGEQLMPSLPTSVRQLFAWLDTHDRQPMVGRVLSRSGLPH